MCRVASFQKSTVGSERKQLRTFLDVKNQLILELKRDPAVENRHAISHFAKYGDFRGEIIACTRKP